MNMNLVRALDRHFLFAFENSRTMALSEADRAQGQFRAVQSLVFPDRQPFARLFAHRPADGARASHQRGAFRLLQHLACTGAAAPPQGHKAGTRSLQLTLKIQGLSEGGMAF